MGSGRSGIAKGLKNTTKRTQTKLGDKTLTPWTGNADANELSPYLTATNPHRVDTNVPYSMYHENCQRCGPALDLRLAGYDVEALGKKRGDRHGVFSDFITESYKHFYENAQWNKIAVASATSAESQIASRLPKVGARAIVRIRWNDGNGNDIGGHVFNIVRTKNGLVGLDGQTNKIFPVQDYLKKGMYNGSMHILVTNKGGGTPDLYKVNESLVDQYLKIHKKKPNKK